MMRANRMPFDPLLTRNETIFGLIYLPLHFLVLPIILEMGMYLYSHVGLGKFNLIVDAVGVLFLAVFMRHYLMRHFDAMLDHKGESALAVLFGYAVNMALSYLLAMVLFGLGMDMGENPNDSLLISLRGQDYSIMRGLAIFIAPFIEETLFRGVLFGSIRRHHRLLAYVVTVTLFALLHVWQYALAAMDWTVLLYIVQYIPLSVALCWCYERSGSIWSPIALHMLVNALAYAVMAYLA